MDSYPIKTVTFGGFDKQDVIRYIEQTAETAVVAQKELQEENERLRYQVNSLSEEATSLRTQVNELTVQRNRLQAALSQETAAKESLALLQPLEDEVLLLRAEVQKLRPDAQAYAQFREQLGAIECEARKRAADLESAASARIRQTVEQFCAQYQELMHTFESTTSHVTTELRKVEVNLSQLPRAMDQAGNDLQQLAEQLEAPKKETATNENLPKETPEQEPTQDETT